MEKGVVKKEALEKRREALAQSKAQQTQQIDALARAMDEIKANFVATDGAIQECDHWLQEIYGEKKEETEE